jgi:hypothetical protein
MRQQQTALLMSLGAYPAQLPLSLVRDDEMGNKALDVMWAANLGLQEAIFYGKTFPLFDVEMIHFEKDCPHSKALCNVVADRIHLTAPTNPQYPKLSEYQPSVDLYNPSYPSIIIFLPTGDTIWIWFPTDNINTSIIFYFFLPTRLKK